jgi:glucosamine-6-phosphate deaminase
LTPRAAVAYFVPIAEESHSDEYSPERLREWLRVPADELAERAHVPLTICASKEELYRHFAQEMFDEIAESARAGEELAVIVPLGPKAHYSLLAQMINAERLSLEHVTYFGMDQWLDWQGRPLPWESPFNLEAYFHRHYLDLVDEDLRPHPGHVLFPSVLELDRASDEIRKRTIATTYGGFGFQGHLAFNEPPSTRWSPVTLDQLRNGDTRVTPVAVDTIIAHAQRALGGNVAGIPPMAATLGMRDLLSARRIRLYTDGGAWKQTVLRILLFAAPTVEYPVTLVRDHPDVMVIVDAESAASPPTEW